MRLLIFKYACNYFQSCVVVQADSVKLDQSSRRKKGVKRKEMGKGRDGTVVKLQKWPKYSPVLFLFQNKAHLVVEKYKNVYLKMSL